MGADHDDLDVAATIATYAGFLGVFVENYEPVTWAEELIEPAPTGDHPRLAFLYAIAAVCYFAGRIEEGVRYSDAVQTALRSGGGEVPDSLVAYLGGRICPSDSPTDGSTLTHPARTQKSPNNEGIPRSRFDGRRFAR